MCLWEKREKNSSKKLQQSFVVFSAAVFATFAEVFRRLHLLPNNMTRPKPDIRFILIHSSRVVPVLLVGVKKWWFQNTIWTHFWWEINTTSSDQPVLSTHPVSTPLAADNYCASFADCTTGPNKRLCNYHYVTCRCRVSDMIAGIGTPGSCRTDGS